MNIIDDYNRETLWIEVDASLPAERVVRVLETLLLWRVAPKQIRVDNGPELISQRLDNWAKEKQNELLHLQPGKPAQNAYIERFNHTFREDVLDAYLFDDLEEVRAITERWLEEYNSIRPHKALQGSPPANLQSKIHDFVYWIYCKSLNPLTTETLSHGVLLFFSQCLRDSVVQKELQHIYPLLMQGDYFSLVYKMGT